MPFITSRAKIDEEELCYQLQLLTNQCHEETGTDAKITHSNVPTTGVNTINLLDLNIDCLEHIFTYLKLVDLSAAGQTCQDFCHLSQRTFCVKYKTNLYLEPGFKSDILRSFGEHTTALQMRDTDDIFFDDREISMLQRYLPNIDALDLSFSDAIIFQSDFITKKIPTLKRLDLDMRMACKANFDLIIKAMEQCGNNLLIEALKFHIRYKSDEWLGFLKIPYPKLRRLIIYPREPINVHRFEQLFTTFCDDHIKLKYLCIIARAISYRTLSDLKKLVNLQELSLGFLLKNKEMVTALTELPALNRLGVVVSYFIDIKWTQPLFELTQLKVFQLSIIYRAADEINRFVTDLIKCGHSPTNVTSFIVQNATAVPMEIIDFDAVARFISISPYAEDLTLFKGFPLNDYFYMRLVDACQQNRLRKIVLEVKLYADDQIQVSKELADRFGHVVSFRIKPLST